MNQNSKKQNIEPNDSTENHSPFICYIPGVVPCPDRFASGVGVPDENKRPVKHFEKRTH